MTDDQMMRLSRSMRLWQIYPTYRRAIGRVSILLGILALVQFVAWLIPATSGPSTIGTYLPLHELLETVSIVIAMLVFAVGWNSHGGQSSGNTVLLACLFFAIGLLDFFHVASYGGMPDVVSHNDADKHLYAWMAARFLASLALLIVTMRPWDRGISNAYKYALFSGLFAATLALVWVVIYHQENLPKLFIPGQGLTPLKKNLEYLYVLTNLVTAVLLWDKLRKPQTFNVPLLFAAVCTMAMGEFYFTLYTTMTGAYNVLGHIYKVISYLLIYRAVVVESIDRPYLELHKSREALQLSREDLSITLNSIGDAVVTTDVRGLITRMNPVAERLTGWTLADALGQPLTEVFKIVGAESHLPIFNPVQLVMERGEVIGLANHTALLARDGQEYQIADSAAPIRDATNAIVGVVLVFSDVTEKYQVDESLRIAKKQLEIFFKYSPVALAMFDRNMCYLYASNQWQQDYGITDRNLHGVSHYEVFPEITETWKAVHQRALAGDLVRADNDRFIRSDGTDQWLQWEVRPWQERSGEVGGILIFTQDITRRKVAESALLEATSHLQATLNAIPDLLFEVDANGRVLSYHAHRNDLLAAPPDVFMGSTFAEVLPPAAAAICMNAMNEAAINGSSSGATYSLPLPHGETWFELSVAAMPVVEGATPRFILLARDITKRKNDEEELRRSEERRSIATNSGQIAIWEVDLFTGKLMWDDNCFLLYKIDKQTFKGTYEEWKQTIHPQDLDTVTKSFQNAVDGISEYDLTFRIIWPDGEVRYIEAHGEVQRNQSGVAQRVIGTNWDVTTIKTQQSQLEHIAHFDALTNLPNRVLLADRLQQSMLQCQRRSQQLAVAFMDLDGFKAINDQCGHAVGDQVLIGLAHRMNEVMRQGDTLARLGGDEFVAVLIDLEEKSAIEPLLDRLLATAAQPFHVDGHSLHVSASIGVTIYPQTIEIDADQLLRQADQSMYQAKLAGKNRYHIFDAVQDSSIRGIHESLQQIRSALKSREFVLYYQPKVNMRTGQVIGAEALIRWQHPEQGLLAPGLFLPVIEDHPLAVDIGEWVIDAALIQMELWISQGMDMRVSVNIGARQLQQGDFVERLRAILAMHPRINPNTLELEILETSALEDVAQISQLIQDCAQLGVSFALDDFGTGYSSLTYLKRLKVKTLKIDQSFVRDMLDDPDDLAILQGVIGLAGALRREVIAEGVETPAHGTALLQLGCELAQGYGIARPMPADQMLGWAATWKPDSSWSDLPWLGGNLHSRFE